MFEIDDDFSAIDAFHNGLGEALGFPGFGQPINQGGYLGGIAFNPTGLPVFQTPSYNTVNDTMTMFENLRWYLCSNFWQFLSQMYVEYGLVQTLVNTPVDDGLRGGIILKSKQLSEEEIKKLQNSMDRDDDINTAGQAAKWNRLYGGAGILILTDEQDPTEPLNLDDINENTDLEFRAVDMWELFWDKQNTEGYDPQIQAQDFEYYSYYSEKVHKTRVMRMKGLVSPAFVRPRLRGWGISVVEALVRSINQYIKSTDLMFEVLDEFKLDVYKIKNLVNTLASPDGTEQVKRRITMSNWQKNYQNALVMDSEDDFDHKQISFAGLAEANLEIRAQVAADMRFPIIKLFGQSYSKGLGNSAQDEMENYNAMVESEVRNKLKYHILRMAEIKCKKIFGFIPDDLEIEFRPLRELNATDQETVKTQKFERLLKAKEIGELTTQEFRDACNKGDLFDIKLDTAEDGVDIGAESANDFAAEEKGRDPNKYKDTEDPGANRYDTRMVRLGTEPKLESPAATDTKKENEIYMRYTFEEVESLPEYTMIEKSLRVLNSAQFDVKSYEADGGENWIAPERLKALMQLGHVTNGAHWEKAKEASRAAFGEIRWPFVMWYYKKHGGKL